MKIVLGFSGGVDSSVSAVLLRRAGWEVAGLYMDNAGAEARNYALEAAARMELPLRVLDVREELEEKVCAPFCAAYLRGETPNPCILCNPAVKFKTLLAIADRLGAEAIATGHYARAEGGALYKGRPSNDQSYMLCRLRREQLSRLVLPLGGLEKRETRALAEQFELPVAHKKDSMEICFIPNEDYVGWMSLRGGASSTWRASTPKRTASSSRCGKSCSRPSFSRAISTGSSTRPPRLSAPRCACGTPSGKSRRAPRRRSPTARCASNATSPSAPPRRDSPPCSMTASVSSEVDLSYNRQVKSPSPQVCGEGLFSFSEEAAADEKRPLSSARLLGAGIRELAYSTCVDARRRFL